MSDASLLLEETYQKKENEQHNQTYILEEQLLRLVRTGAAIEGGLDYDTAYQLSDYFIQFSERLTSADRLTDLLGKVSYTFAEKVAQSKTPSPESADGGY